MKKIIASSVMLCIFLPGLSQTGINNLSFENWTSFGGPAPSGFIAKGASQINSGAQHLNSYARLTSNGQATTSTNASGAMQLGGIIGNTPFGGAPYTLEPIALTGYYKCALIGQDTVYIAIDLTKNGQSVLDPAYDKKLIMTATQSAWTYFSIALKYLGNSNPDSVHIYMTANKSFAGSVVGSAGTVLDMDNFTLLPNTTGVREFSDFDLLFSAYPNPAKKDFYIVSGTEDCLQVEIYSLSGACIERKKFEEKKVVFSLNNYEPGLYFYKVIGSRNKILKTEKFLVAEN